MKKTRLMQRAERRAGIDLEAYLRKEYIENERPPSHIAVDLRVGKNSITYWMDKFGIPTRTHSEAQTIAKLPENFKSAELQRAESKIREPIDVFLRREYEDNQRPATEIATEVGVHHATVYTWLRNHDIPIREKSEAQSLAKLPPGFKKPTKRQIERWYVDQGKSSSQIGEDLGVTETTVLRIMEDYSIARRDFSECQLNRGVRKPSKSQLRQWYIDERRSANEIAEEVGVTNTTVLGWLKKHRIPARSNSQAQFNKVGKDVRKPNKRQLNRWYHSERKGTGEIARDLGVTQRTIMNWMIDYDIPTRSPQEAKLGKGVKRPPEEELERMYVDESMSTVQMAKEIGVKSSSTVSRWLNEHGIKRERPSNEDLRRLYHKEGLNAIEIGKIYDVTSTQVYYWMKKHEIPRRDFSESKLPEGARKPDRKELEEMWENNTLGNISEKLGVSENTVRNWINEYQIPLKRKVRGVGSIRTPQQLEKFLQETPQASDVGSLVTVTENVGDVAEVFVQLWPERFPSAADLARSLPSAVQRIGYSLHPFSMDKARWLYDKLRTTSREVQYALGDILFQIAIDQHQQQFNDDPQGTLKDLSEHAKARNGFGKLAKRVYRHYKEVAGFNIPGHGRMKEVA